MEKEHPADGSRDAWEHERQPEHELKAAAVPDVRAREGPRDQDRDGEANDGVGPVHKEGVSNGLEQTPGSKRCTPIVQTPNGLVQITDVETVEENEGDRPNNIEAKRGNQNQYDKGAGTREADRRPPFAGTCFVSYGYTARPAPRLLPDRRQQAADVLYRSELVLNETWVRFREDIVDARLAKVFREYIVLGDVKAS